MKKHVFALALVLAASLSCTSALAVQIPDEIIRENEDGRQTVTKVYTLDIDEDPQQLIEDDFEQDGYLYAYYDIQKSEQAKSESKAHEEIVTISTNTNKLEQLLPLFASSIPFEADGFAGTLYLDHTSISAQATGYSSKSYQVTETKQIGPLDRNDPSYVPATTVKDGRTLSLTNIEWSVQGTSLADDALIPSSYMATASYAAKVSYSVADGYTATARYTGEIASNTVDSISYTVVYLGRVVETEPEPKPLISPALVSWLITIAVLAVVLGAVYAVYVIFFRRNVKVYALAADDAEYELITRSYLNRKHCNIDVSKIDAGLHEAVIEIQKRAANNLFGKTVTVIFGEGQHTHRIKRFNEDTYCYTASIPAAHEEVPAE